MDWLNYHHLLYFWTVASEGGLRPAAEKLRLTQSTISSQIHSLEDALELTLFERSGRKMRLTEDGEMVRRYADEIFGLGTEMLDTIRGRPTGKPLRLRVGISDALPKNVCHDLLEPALELDEPVHIMCHGDKTERLLARLAVRGLDLVLADEPVGGSARVKAFNHLLGECAISFFATRELAERYRKGFPNSLDGAPLLLPTRDHLVRRSLDLWFESLGVRPSIIAEFDDTGLLKNFGQGGAGIFSAASVVDGEIQEQYGVEEVGRCEDVQERFYAITLERRIKNRAVAEISRFAKERLFATQTSSSQA